MWCRRLTLTKIAVYEASQRLRKRRRIQDFAVDPEAETQNMENVKSSDAGPEQETLNHEARSLLEQAIDSLPPSYRSVVVFRDIENLSTAETAECLELSEENVKVRLLRARDMLRQDLYERAGATSSQAFQFMGARCDRIVSRVLEKIHAKLEGC